MTCGGMVHQRRPEQLRARDTDHSSAHARVPTDSAQERTSCHAHRPAHSPLTRGPHQGPAGCQGGAWGVALPPPLLTRRPNQRPSGGCQPRGRAGPRWDGRGGSATWAATA
eukprot:12248761-Alexandrium_andersonii.AAC.1